jgi:hypothetical protein
MFEDIEAARPEAVASILDIAADAAPSGKGPARFGDRDRRRNR